MVTRTMTQDVNLTLSDNSAFGTSFNLLPLVSSSDIVTDVRLSLLGLTHTNAADLDVLVVAPDGRQMMVMSDLGATSNLTQAILTFADTGGTTLPLTDDGDDLDSGLYQPLATDITEALTDFGLGDRPSSMPPARRRPLLDRCLMASWATGSGGSGSAMMRLGAADRWRRWR